MNHVLRRCAKAAGVEKDVTSHALRRTANNLVRQTSGDLVARMITGHTTVAMTEHYSLVDADERAEALRKAFGTALGTSGGANVGGGDGGAHVDGGANGANGASGTSPTTASAETKTPRA